MAFWVMVRCSFVQLESQTTPSASSLGRLTELFLKMVRSTGPFTSTGRSGVSLNGPRVTSPPLVRVP